MDSFGVIFSLRFTRCLWFSNNTILFFGWGFLNLWPRNSDMWTYVISDIQGYLYSHRVSTKFAIIIPFLSSFCVISDNTVVGSIIVTDFGMKFSFPFLPILWGPVNSTQSFLQDVSSTNLMVHLPHFYWPFYYARTSCTVWIPFRRWVLFRDRINVGKSSLPHDTLQDEEYSVRFTIFVP